VCDAGVNRPGSRCVSNPRLRSRPKPGKRHETCGSHPYSTLLTGIFVVQPSPRTSRTWRGSPRLTPRLESISMPTRPYARPRFKHGKRARSCSARPSCLRIARRLRHLQRAAQQVVKPMRSGSSTPRPSASNGESKTVSITPTSSPISPANRGRQRRCRSEEFRPVQVRQPRAEHGGHGGSDRRLHRPPAAKYVVETTLNDKMSSKIGKFELPFEIKSSVSPSSCPRRARRTWRSADGRA
jgi:hypothetical protein